MSSARKGKGTKRAKLSDDEKEARPSKDDIEIASKLFSLKSDISELQDRLENIKEVHEQILDLVKLAEEKINFDAPLSATDEAKCDDLLDLSDSEMAESSDSKDEVSRSAKTEPDEAALLRLENQKLKAQLETAWAELKTERARNQQLQRINDSQSVELQLYASSGTVTTELSQSQFTPALPVAHPFGLFAALPTNVGDGILPSHPVTPRTGRGHKGIIHPAQPKKSSKASVSKKHR